MSDISCFCHSEKMFSECCEPYIKGLENAPTALALMRSRYTAYAIVEPDYLIETTHISTKKNHSKADILDWSKSNQWLKLEILHFSETTVEFKAYFLDESLEPHIHHEKSTFKFDKGKWFYVNGKFL